MKKLHVLLVTLPVALMAQSTGVVAASKNLPSQIEEEVTITATRLERDVQNVPEAIAVIGQERIANSRMFNLTDALSGTPGVTISSKNGGYDARLILRGGGLKANYGIREIFLMRDGVPITDPDSFTRLDFIDTQDVQQIEVTKGPGNIYATGSTAGVIHLISRSVFAQEGNSLALGVGNDGQRNVSVRLGTVQGNHALALSASLRQDDNDWRRNNEFESRQVGIKYGFRADNDDELTLEISYADVDLDLPGNLSQTQFEQYKRSDKQRDNNSFFKNGGRYSETWHANARYVMALSESLTFKPRLYYTRWQHFHPVTPFIVENGGVDVFGGDLEFAWQQSFGSLVAGVTYRQDIDDDSRRYEYRDLSTDFDRFLEPGEGTLSQARGDLAELQDTRNTVKGVFAQQSITAFDNWVIHLSARYDSINIDQQVHELSKFNFPYGTVFGPPVPGRSAYKKIDERSAIDKTFELLTLRAGVSYQLSDSLSLYANLARGEQVPFSNELETNHSLDSSLAQSAELGLKGRADSWAFDLAIYHMTVDDEVVAGLDQHNQTVFQNAGKIIKDGLEFTSNLQLLTIANGELWGGVNFAYSDYRFDSFTETFRSGPAVVSNNNDGNQLPYIPRQQFTVHALYQHASGVTVRLQADNWGEYYIDNANSDKHEGYDWVTSLNLRYRFLDNHSVSLNVQNLSDKRYATQVSKNAGRNVSYVPGEPRSWLLSYRYEF